MVTNAVEHQQILFAASQAIAASLDLEQVYRALHNATVQLMPVEIFIITLLDAPNAEVEVVYQVADKHRAAPTRFPAHRGLTGHILATGQTIRNNHFSQQPLDVVLVGGERMPQAVLAAPLRHGEAILGMLSAQSYSAVVYTEADENALVLLANQAASAIANARLYNAMRAQANYLAALNDITHTMLETSDYAEMFRRLSAQLKNLLHADDCFINQWDAVQQRAIPTAGYDKYPDYHPAMPGEKTMTASVLEAEHVLAIEDVQTTPLVSARIAAQFPARSMLGLPLMAEGQKIGAALVAYNTPHRFTAEEIKQGEEVAARISLAIVKARLYQRATAEQSRLHAVLNASRDGVALIGLDQRLLVVNAAMLHLLRIPGPPDQWLQKRFAQIWRPLRRYAPAAFRACLAELRRTHHGQAPTSEGEFAEGETHIHWFNVPVLTGETSIGRLILLRDVSENWQLEKLRNDLMHTMVHDLRNPLAGIMMTFELLESDAGLSTDSREILALAQRSADKMNQLVNAILDISRLESGQMPLELKALDVSKAVTNAMDVQALFARDKAVQLEQDVALNLPLVYADTHLLGRVFQNLVGNAIKFTEQGAVRVSAYRAEETPSMVKVLVQDSGPGISAELRPRLFQKFATGESRYRGSGLGLAFCRLAIEAQGGRIWAESEPGKGSTFIFTLPVAH